MLPNCCGRSRRAVHKTAAGVDEEPANVERAAPPGHVLSGASAYARHNGLPDPHNGETDFSAIRSSSPLLREVAHHYDRMPEHDPGAVKHFEAMRQEVLRQHDFMTHKMGLHTEVTHDDPYENFKQMHHDVTNNHRIRVMSDHATGGHPYFSPEENEKFRAVHDVFGHIAGGGGFDRHGEEAAFHAHALMFSPHARPALATETRGQFASSVVNGKFGPQKIAVMPRHLWTPQHSRFASVDWQEFRLLEHAQNVRSERAGIGGSKDDRDAYFGLGEHGGGGSEHRANPKEWMQHSRSQQLEDTDPEFQENFRGYELGRAHGRTGRVGHEELDREWRRSPHPDHFSAGYEEGLDETLNNHKVVAVLVAGMDDMPSGMRVTAHVSGNSVDVLHCPFCGSGAVIARSDGTIECGYCTSIFTVQVQPAYAGFPQSVDGQPYQWPGMPDPNAVMAPDAPPGTNVNPLQQDPMGAGGAAPLGDGGLLGVDGGGLPPQSSDPADGEEDGDDEGDEGGNPFAKGGDDDSDSKGDKPKSDKKKPPQKKSSVLVSGGVYGTYLLKTANGAQLTANEFEAHLAMKYANNPLVVAQRVRESRANGTL